MEPGDTSITLKQPVTWKVGDHIALATTGDRSSMKENEEHHIAAISEDGYTITLTEPLKYRHISIEQTFDDKVVETRGEVGLLTRNILIKGTINEQFTEVLPACDQEFSSGGAFSDAMQTCFAGKFGEELGTDEMGAVIIISPKFKDQGLVSARFEYVELTSVGQAFRVGRYPIHFHLPGNQNESYIRGVSVHHSNNRACTLHDVSNMTVEHNVAYSIKGLTFFLEDGVEMYNTLQYNLAMFTRMSNSLLNPDINPASFWIVNPYNKFRHNACAGGTHLCFWLRPAKVPDGPSFVRKYCPYRVPFDEFHNNTAHSMGWYGFWIFGQSNKAKYDPHTGTLDNGFCDGHRTQARIGSFTTWNNKRGFEIVSGGNIRLENQTHMDHDFSAYEIFTGRGQYGSEGAGIFNSIIVGHSRVSDLTTGKENKCTPIGIHLPRGGYTIENVKFYNFDNGTETSDCYAMGVKLEEDGEALIAIRTSGLEFINTTTRTFIDDKKEQGFWMIDADGTLTGTPDTQLVTKSGTNPPACTDDTSGHFAGIDMAVCDDSVVFHRINIVEPSPSSLQFNKLTIKNEYGSSDRVWMFMNEGWNALLPQGPLNLMAFDTVEHLTNISYFISAYGMHKGENYLILGHDLNQQPDRFIIVDGKESNSSDSLASPPTYNTAQNGDWYFNNETGGPTSQVQYILSSNSETKLKNKWKRSTDETERTGDIGVWPQNGIAEGTFSVVRCETEGCIPKPPPTMDPSRPESFIKWSEPADWADAELDPPLGQDIISIPRGAWVVLDTNPPKFSKLYVYGTLEVEDTEDRRLEVEILLVMGGRLIVGEKEKPFENKFELYLHGNHYTTDQPMFNAPNLGAKALGVYGDSIRTSVYPGLIDMHGKDIGQSWVKLAKTVQPGDTTIELTDEVAWAAGDKVVISATDYESLETEKRVIASVSGKILTVTEALEFSHLSVEESLGSKSYKFRAEVGLLSRNVKIIGAEYDDQEEEMFGARVIAAAFKEGGLVKPGYARMSNVEFIRAGQEGWSDNFDPRYSLVFMDSSPAEYDLLPIGEINSYVENCAFDYNYNSGIGIFGSTGVAIRNNVLYRHINDGIIDEGTNTEIIKNLVVMGESINEFKDLTFAFEFKGCINTLAASGTILQDNVMAGCAQGGLVTRGVPCTETYTWTGNEIHSTQHAVHVNGRGFDETGCRNVKDFYVWRNYEYGLMINTEDNVEAENMTLIENGVAMLVHGVGPSAISHEIKEDSHASITKSTIIANVPSFNCNEKAPRILSFSPEANRAWTGKKSGYTHTGIILPIFQSKYGKINMKYHQALKGAAGSNPTLRGILYIEEVSFVNFDGSCGEKDTVFRTNTLADDVNWPVHASKLNFDNVNEDFKVLFDRPLASKINPADCTDFDCDGMKKAMIVDKDGTLIGNGGGTVIADSAFEWDGNPAKGLGYYRVPKPMVTEVNGDKIPYQDKMPNKGIFRNDQCSWEEGWTAYKCKGANHKLMIMESLDRDTRIRRLSPIAVLADPGENGYIDLVNGPQDHSCCQGYTCAERLSTFYMMVAPEKEHEIVLSSIPPQKFRFHLLYNDEEAPVRIKMWFPKQQRLDIYSNGEYVAPNNKDFSVIDNLKLFPPDNTYIPEMTDLHCANYFDPNTGHLYLLVRGKFTCDIKTQPVVVLKLGITVKEDEFFDEDKIVANIAGLLGIPLNKIRITNIVREGSVRRKRSTDEEPGVEFQIAEPPSLTTEESFVEPLEVGTTPANPNDPTVDPSLTTATTPGTTTTTEFKLPNNDEELNFEKLVEVSSKMASLLQSGKLSESLGVNVTSMEATKPIEPPEEEPEYTSPEERAAVLDKTFAEKTAEEDKQKLAELNEADDVLIPKNLFIGREIYEAEEMTKMEFYPYVQMTTAKGEILSVVGGAGDPWLVTASLVTGPEGAEVVENTTVPFVKGFANFTGLLFSKEGPGYSVKFELTYPTDVVIAPATNREFAVKPRPLGILIDDLSEQVPENEDQAVKFYIYDLGLGEKATPEVIGNRTWECTLGWPITVPVLIEGQRIVSIDKGIVIIIYFHLKMLYTNIWIQKYF